jgi:hypothetical protein
MGAKEKPVMRIVVDGADAVDGTDTVDGTDSIEIMILQPRYGPPTRPQLMQGQLRNGLLDSS